jgi:hypothetical protein
MTKSCRKEAGLADNARASSFRFSGRPAATPSHAAFYRERALESLRPGLVVGGHRQECLCYLEARPKPCATQTLKAR